MNIQLEDSFENLGNALSRLREAVEQTAAANSLEMDGTIQRFEFCIDQTWKWLRRLLLAQGQDVPPLPKAVLQKAYMVGWLEDEKMWLAMLDDRNQTSHTYNRELAKEIYQRIKIYYPVMQSIFDHLRNKYGKVKTS